MSAISVIQEAFFFLFRTRQLKVHVGTASENYDGASRGRKEAEEFSSNQNAMKLFEISTWHAILYSSITCLFEDRLNYDVDITNSNVYKYP